MIVREHIARVVVGKVVCVIVTGVIDVVDATDRNRGGVSGGARPRSRLGSWQG